MREESVRLIKIMSRSQRRPWTYRQIRNSFLQFRWYITAIMTTAKRLESLGVVRRTHSRTNGETLIRLTAKGRALIALLS